MEEKEAIREKLQLGEIADGEDDGEKANGGDNVEKADGGDEIVLKFMDSMDNYLTLFDSLSSMLGQGWLQLASARHSMGALRINSALLDHQPHDAATTLQVIADSEEPSFVLRKWGTSFNNGNSMLDEKRYKEDCSLPNTRSLKLRHYGNSQISHDSLDEQRASANGGSLKVDDQVQKERLKSLSVFGTLVPPKLRAAQMSFETALETLIEIANMRSIMLSSFDEVQTELGANKRTT